MKIAAINTVEYGSTGRIMLAILEQAKKSGHEIRAYSRGWKRTKQGSEEHRYIGNYWENGLHRILTDITGLHGMFSFFGTYKLIRDLSKWKPDLIHLHNLHPSFINLPMLFRYIKKNHIRVIWTLHDCWAFTGQCPHFTLAKCDKWMNGCHDCPQYREYPASYVDQTKLMWKLKKRWFTGVEDLTIVTPSQWLADLVKKSYLKEYPVQVIHNGIDLNVFHPVETDFRKKYKLEHKKIVLGVSFNWGYSKGLDVFVSISKLLPDSYQIVLVGTNEESDKNLPQNIISIHRTQNQQELVRIYSAADVFVNPTRQENYPTVNMEALACGTPVITFNTGGSPETILDNYGSVVPCDDISELIVQIKMICEDNLFSREKCAECSDFFSEWNGLEEYMSLINSQNKKDR